MAAADQSPFYEENGRHYGSFRRGQYFLPCDERERDRLDLMMTLFQTIRDRENRLLHAPFQERLPGPRGEASEILDLGCGTGIWLLEMAARYTHTNFLGIDIHPMGPRTLLPNVDLNVPIDYERPWSLGEQSWDVIHLQMGLGSVSNWRDLYSKIKRHLVPGTGWFESVEMDLTPRSDDNSLPNGKLMEWYQYVRDAYTVTGRTIEYNPNTGAELELAGFRDVNYRVYQMAWGGWPEGRAQHRGGTWFDIAMGPGEGGERTGGYGLEAISLAVLTRYFQWPEDHVRRLCREAWEQTQLPGVHAYCNLHVWWARAPGPDEIQAEPSSSTAADYARTAPAR